MNAKRILGVGILPILTILLLATVTVFNISLKSPREKFENFLVSEYQNVPDISIEDYENMPGPTRPDLAAYQNYFMTLDPELGRVPAERWRNAYEETEKYRHQANLKSTSSIEWQTTGATMGGRTRTIMFDPNDLTGKKVWAGGVTGGLWYNNDITNYSSEWISVDNFWASLSVSCIASDPNNPHTFYVGTGESWTAFTTYRESSGVGVGIYTSTDGGNNWQLLQSTEDFKYVNDVVVRDENGISVIYAGVASGFYHGEVHQSEPGDGLYRSDDGGVSWEQVLPDMTAYDYSYTVNDITLGSDNRLYVGSMQNLNQEGGAVILWSDEGTEGSWTTYDDYNIIIQNTSYPVPGRVIFTEAPSDENIIYALIGSGRNEGFMRYYCQHILKSEDKGVTWNEINNPDSYNWATLAWHALTACVNPEDPDLLYIGGLDVWNTLNGGQNWSHVSDWGAWGGSPDYVHADQHMQMYRPGSSTEMVFTTDGGVFYTDEANSSSPDFIQVNNNFNTLQFYACDIFPVEGVNRFVGGLQDNGSLYYTGSPISLNDMVSGGDGAFCFFDKNQPNYMITSVYYNRYYIFNNGSNINNIYDYQSGVFINPADLDYKENILYANAVTFSVGNANRILRLSNIYGNEEGQIVYCGTAVPTWFSHVKYSPFSVNGTATLFVGSNSGRLYKLLNAHATPEATDIGSVDFPLGSISSVAIGGSEDTLLVTFSNYGISSVWQTFDGGQTWMEKEGNLPDMPIRWAIYHPQNTQQAMLATECGIWVTNELHQSITNWEPAIEGMANVRVDMIKVREADNTVLAGTHGRGMFWTEYPVDLYTGVDQPEPNTGLRIYPNPTKGMLNIEFKNANQPEIILYDLTGKIILKEQSHISDQLFNQSYDLSNLPDGLYLLTVQNGSTLWTEKVVLK